MRALASRRVATCLGMAECIVERTVTPSSAPEELPEMSNSRRSEEVTKPPPLSARCRFVHDEISAAGALCAAPATAAAQHSAAIPRSRARAQKLCIEFSSRIAAQAAPRQSSKAASVPSPMHCARGAYATRAQSPQTPPPRARATSQPRRSPRNPQHPCTGANSKTAPSFTARQGTGVHEARRREIARFLAV